MCPARFSKEPGGEAEFAVYGQNLLEAKTQIVPEEDWDRHAASNLHIRCPQKVSSAGTS